jgi:hypothetical protein
MVVMPVSNRGENLPIGSERIEQEGTDWVALAASGTLLAAGVLMLLGNRRAGTVAAASGAVLTLVDQQDVVKKWWKELPVCLDRLDAMMEHAQGTLEQAQGMVDNLAAKREKLHTMLRR